MVIQPETASMLQKMSQLTVGRVLTLHSGVHNVRMCVLLKVWSGSLGRPVAHIGDKSSGSAVCVVFHPDGQQVLAGFHSGHLKLYDIATGMSVLCGYPCIR